MGDPYVGEIRLFANIDSQMPEGWLECDGKVLQIAQYKPLFALIGTLYGGDGTTTFKLPDLRGRVPMQFVNPTFPFASTGGEATHTLALAEMPAHNHPLMASTSPGTQDYAVANLLANTSGTALYETGSNPNSPLTQMDPYQIADAGGGLPHENMQPYCALRFCISNIGTFPTRN